MTIKLKYEYMELCHKLSSDIIDEINNIVKEISDVNQKYALIMQTLISISCNYVLQSNNVSGTFDDLVLNINHLITDERVVEKVNKLRKK